MIARRVALSVLAIAIVSALGSWYVARSVSRNLNHRLCVAIYGIDGRQIKGTRYQIRTATAFVHSTAPAAVRSIYRHQLPSRRVALASAIRDRDALDCSPGIG